MTGPCLVSSSCLRMLLRLLLLGMFVLSKRGTLRTLPWGMAVCVRVSVCVSVCEICGVYVCVSLCVYLCAWCVFTPVWWLQPCSSGSRALVSGLTLSARKQSSHADRVWCVGRTGDELPMEGVYRPAQSPCLAVWHAHCFFRGRVSVVISRDRTLRKPLSRAPECLTSWGVLFL